VGDTGSGADTGTVSDAGDAGNVGDTGTAGDAGDAGSPPGDAASDVMLITDTGGPLTVATPGGDAATLNCGNES
jgi:hypothetical protein